MCVVICNCTLLKTANQAFKITCVSVYPKAGQFVLGFWHMKKTKNKIKINTQQNVKIPL